MPLAAKCAFNVGATTLVTGRSCSLSVSPSYMCTSSFRLDKPLLSSRAVGGVKRVGGVKGLTLVMAFSKSKRTSTLSMLRQSLLCIVRAFWEQSLEGSNKRHQESCRCWLCKPARTERGRQHGSATDASASTGPPP